MLDIAAASLMARDLTERQFSSAAPRPRTLTAATAETELRAPVRRSTVRVLRRVADRLEPAPRCAPQG